MLQCFSRTGLLSNEGEASSLLDRTLEEFEGVCIESLSLCPPYVITNQTANIPPCGPQSVVEVSLVKQFPLCTRTLPRPRGALLFSITSLVCLLTSDTEMTSTISCSSEFNGIPWRVVCSGTTGYYLFSLMKTWRCQVTCENYESSETDPVMIADNFSDKGKMWS